MLKIKSQDEFITIRRIGMNNILEIRLFFLEIYLINLRVVIVHESPTF